MAEPVVRELKDDRLGFIFVGMLARAEEVPLRNDLFIASLRLCMRRVVTLFALGWHRIAARNNVASVGQRFLDGVEDVLL